MTCSRSLTLALSVVWVWLSGCAPDWGPPGPERIETRNIAMDPSEEVRVELNMGAGELTVGGGADNLMEGRFIYHRLRLRPEVSYDASGFRSHIIVREPSHVGTATRRYAWDLRFNDKKPLDLEVNFGAGECRLDLGELTLRRVGVHMGVGKIRMDLRGMPKQDYSVDVHGGIGEATIYVPKNVGVEAHMEGGIGDIDTLGMSKRDGRYVNDSYGRTDTNIHLDIKGGIGAIHLISD